MDDLQGQDLKLAYWYNTHRDQVRTIAYGLGIAAVSVVWLSVIILLIRMAMNWSATNRAITDISTSQIIYDSIQAPQSLTVTMSDAVSHTSDTIDAYAIVHNPNTYYAARFSYTVTIQGTAYDYTDGYVMPNTDSYLVVSGVTGTATSSADVKITETNWQRIRGPQPKTEFVVQDIVFAASELPVESTPASTTTPEGFVTPEDTEATDEDTVPGQTISQLSANVTNASAYGFRQVKVTGLIKTPAGTIEGVQQVIFSDVQSFSDTALLFSWQRRFNFNSETAVIVETDVWNSDNLIKPGEE